MGTVHQAERCDGQYHKTVALKVVTRGMDTESVLTRFRTERQILAQLDHPNIARLFDGGLTSDGRPYIVMEYIEGTPIDVYCDRRQLSVEQRLRLFLVVCAAVEHAHKNRVIHGDIKPSNVFVSQEGVPKLLDFGIAKMLAPSRPDATTVTGFRPLTPDFASP